MSSTAQIRTAIAAVLQAAYTSWNVSPYFLSKPEAPQLDLLYGPVVYDTASQGGDDEISLTVRAMAQWGDTVSGQEYLDAVLDGGTIATGLKNVLQAASWGGTIAAIKVVSASEPKVYPNTDGICVEFVCRVYT